jgi:hypothetical protein
VDEVTDPDVGCGVTPVEGVPRVGGIEGGGGDEDELAGEPAGRAARHVIPRRRHHGNRTEQAPAHLARGVAVAV